MNIKYMEMKRTWTLVVAAQLALAAAAQTPKGNLQKGDYGYLYCHMNDRSRAWTAYALSRDGLHYHDLLNGDSIFSDHEHARIEGATRDAYICRKHDGTGYLMVCTDMNVGRFKDLGKKAEWDNYGIDLLVSDDLIHWRSKTFDYRQGTTIFCNPEAESVYKDWSTINRVWAPQIMWDGDYRWPDGRQGGYFIYYSMWNRAEEKYDRMYYSYADESFTQLTQPRLLFDWGYATIDADINWLESDRKWHMMIKKEGGQPGLFTTAAAQLTGPWPEPVVDDYVNFEGNKKCEGVSAFQLAGHDDWVIGYIEYSSKPKNYRLCMADKFMRNFQKPRNIEGVNRPQHGSFLRLTKEEYDRLQAWSDGYELATMKPNLKNPVIPGLYADPEVLYSERDGKYYLYPTTDGCEEWDNHDFRCYSSTDLREWKPEGVIFDLQKDCQWAKRKAWAPCIIERKVTPAVKKRLLGKKAWKGKKDDGYMYFYYFVGEGQIGVAVSDQPTGPFKDVLGRPLCPKDMPVMKQGGATIDPDVFQDPKTGKYYLYWGNGTIVCAELADDMVSFRGEPTVVLPRKDKGRYNYNEGAYVFYRNGLYYFTWSENDTRSKNYRVRYAISDSPTALVRNGQPVTAAEKTIVLERDDEQQIFGTGHHAVVQKPGTDEWFIVYHRFQRPQGAKLDWSAGYHREVCIDPLTFDADGKINPVKPSR